MKSNMIVGVFGLSDEQISTVETNLPVKNCEIMATDCFSDIVAISEMAIIVMWEKLSEDDKEFLVGFYSEIAPFSETMILIGNVDIPDYLERIRANDIDGAAEILMRKNPLPAITSRVCSHFCMMECVR